MKKILRIIAIPLLLLLTAPGLHAAKPLMGIAGMYGDTPRAQNIARLFSSHINNVMRTSGIFDQVNPKLLQQELATFNCLEDSCVLRFARTAKIDIIIRGTIEDRGDTLSVHLYAFGIRTPYFGRNIYSYRVEIPLAGYRLAAQEFSYICEEHAGHFSARMLDRYQSFFPLKKLNNTLMIQSDYEITGTFDLYRTHSKTATGTIRPFSKIGKVRIEKNRVHIETLSVNTLSNNDFILVSHKAKAQFIRNFYYGRKHEIVFDKPNISDTVYILLFTVPASASMPLLAPTVGYYQNSDYRGLAFWMLNASPYLYIQYDGWTNRPEELRNSGESINKRNLTNYYFGWYMTLCGGMALFVDAFSHQYIAQAANYQRSQSLMGNSLTAAYLSTISGGGGHFYRGYRAWGYLYFHINNILIYYAIQNLVKEEKYDATTNTYSEGEANTKRAWSILGVLALVKTIEVIHVVFTRDNIRNGIISANNDFDLQPRIFIDEEKRFSYGAQCTYKF